VVKILLGLIKIQTEAKAALGNSMYEDSEKGFIEMFRYILCACAETVGTLLAQEASTKLSNRNHFFSTGDKRHFCAQMQFFQSVLEVLVPNRVNDSMNEIITLLQQSEKNKGNNEDVTELVNKMLQDCSVYLDCFQDPNQQKQEQIRREDISIPDDSSSNPFQAVRKMGPRRSIAEKIVL